MKNAILKRLFRIFAIYSLVFPIYWLGHLLPRNRRRWVFGNGNGVFADNGRYVMEYVQETQGDIQACWLARSERERNQVRALGFKSEILWSLPGMYWAFRAAVGFQMISQADLNRATLGGMKTIMLWHGTPLKRLLKDSAFEAWWKGSWYEGLVNFLRARVMPYGASQYSMVTCASPLAAERLSSAFDMPLARIQITGDPRGDIVLAQPPRPSEWLASNVAAGTRIVLFAPTFRGHGGESQVGADFDLAAWEEFLERENTVLLIKLHPLAGLEPELKQQISHSPWVKLLTPADCEDVNILLPFVDILATDYSSIMFDYSLLERPIVMFAPDSEKYSDERGMYEPYPSLTEGRWSVDWPEFMSEIGACIEDPGQHIERTRSIRQRYATHTDTNSRERIVRFVRKFVKIS